jgi:Recombination endonuclease VII.
MLKKIGAAALVEMRKAKLGCNCPICQEPMIDLKLMVVDHDHHTGEIRGVICRWCNAQLGKVENAANRAKRNLSVVTWLANAMMHRADHTGLMYPTHLTDAEKAAKTAAKRKAAAVAKAAAKLKAK